jgi:5-methylcytosine-specific restriction endonuclease McrA
VLKFFDELPGTLSKYDQLALKRRVLERDGHKCVLCWAKGDRLTVHHFLDDPSDPIFPVNVGSVRDPYVETQMYDLVTLDDKCHGKIEKSDPRCPLASALRTVVQAIYRATLLEVS